MTSLLLLLLTNTATCITGHWFQDREPGMGELLETRLQVSVQQQHPPAVVQIQEEQIQTIE